MVKLRTRVKAHWLWYWFQFKYHRSRFKGATTIKGWRSLKRPQVEIATKRMSLDEIRGPYETIYYDQSKYDPFMVIDRSGNRRLVN